MQNTEGGRTSTYSMRLMLPRQIYATIEQECLAIQWTVRKCNYYLKGLPDFKILTDHRPLVGIFAEKLHMIENSRLMSMRAKLTNYSFTISWVEGKSHYIADDLSRRSAV